MFGSNHYLNGNLLGVVTFRLTNLSRAQAVTAWLATIVLNLILLALATMAFQWFWAWCIPALWAAAPVLDYWHAFATLTILLVFLNALKGHESKDS